MAATGAGQQLQHLYPGTWAQVQFRVAAFQFGAASIVKAPRLLDQYFFCLSKQWYPWLANSDDTSTYTATLFCAGCPKPNTIYS